MCEPYLLSPESPRGPFQGPGVAGGWRNFKELFME